MNIPICCSQQQIAGRCAVAEECSPQQIKKKQLGKCICEMGMQEIGENLYAVWSPYRACTPVRFMLQISVNISGVPFNKGKPTQDGRIEGGYSAGIEDHPHQVNLSIFC